MHVCVRKHVPCALEAFTSFTRRRISVTNLEKAGFLPAFFSGVPAEGMHRALPGGNTEDSFAPAPSLNAKRETTLLQRFQNPFSSSCSLQSFPQGGSQGLYL